MMTVMMMMVVIGVMIMMKIDFDWYGGYKKQGSKSLNKRRALTRCLEPIKVLGLVYVRRRKTTNRKIVGINMTFLYLMTRCKKLF